MSHEDEHYCAALLRYLKEKAAETREESVLLFSDDKAKVPIGDPGSAVSTGVRGKKTLTSVNTTLRALDHDMNTASLTPSVTLKCEIPEDASNLFVRGIAHVSVNDSIFQQSIPFRHASMVVKVLEQGQIPPILYRYTDGGADQRSNLEKVKCANICLFMELNLDLLVHARCAPGHSFVNPAERVMSLLNLALQNCSLKRDRGPDDAEKAFRYAGSMNKMREAAENNQDIKKHWTESIEHAQSFIRNRFLHLKLKDEPLQAQDPVPDVDMDTLKRHLRELFPDLALNKLQKSQKAKNEPFQAWLKKHARERAYSFQLMKCKHQACCAPLRSKQDLS